MIQWHYDVISTVAKVNNATECLPSTLLLSACGLERGRKMQDQNDLASRRTYRATRACSEVTVAPYRTKFSRAFLPNLRDKIWNGKPGYGSESECESDSESD